MVWFSFLHYTSLYISCDKNFEEFLMLCFMLWTSCFSFLSINIYVYTWVDLLFVNMDGKHLIQGYLYQHGTNQFQFNLNQLVNCHTKSFNIPHMWRILIMRLTLEFSRRQWKPMVRLWKLTSSTYLVLLYETSSQNGVKILYKIILTVHLMSWTKHFRTMKNDEKIYMLLKNL
jgi:hypothetical protein